MTKTAEFIAGFEGYAGRAYWDVNAWRLGYGSDTEGPEQTPVTEGMETTKARAIQNLALRIPEFQNIAVYGKTGMGSSVWQRLTENQKSAITSLVYNYGRLPIIVTPSDPEKTADAIRALQNANGGVNRRRRLAEAAFYLTPDSVPVPVPRPAPVPQVPVPPSIPTQPQIPADAAGRITAVADAIHRAREARIAQLIAADPEIVAYDAMLAGIGNLSPPALPPPAIPAEHPPKGTKVAISLPANWKTTLSGIIAAASQGIGTAFPQYSWITDWLTPIALSALGLTAKDSNVTGGTVQQ